MLDPDNVIISCFVLENILLLACSVALCPALDHQFHIGKFQGPQKQRLWAWMVAALHSVLHHILILDRVDEGILQEAQKPHLIDWVVYVDSYVQPLSSRLDTTQTLTSGAKIKESSTTKRYYRR
jgi:hypothetical protein